MRRFGYAIRVGGDPEISGALRDGMERGTREPYPPFGVLPHCGGEANGKALGPRAAQGLRNVTMRRHTPEELEAMIEEARVVYGGQRHTPRWATQLLAGYALICYGVSLAFHAQDRVIEVSRDGGDRSVW